MAQYSAALVGGDGRTVHRASEAGEGGLMRVERGRRWGAAAVVALVGLGVSGCSSSDKKDDAAKGSAAESSEGAGPGNGRVLIILDEAGRLASVDPETGDRREIADTFVIPGGLPVRSSGLALYQAKGKPDEDGEESEPDGRLVIVDANGATATPTIALKSAPDQYGDGGGDPEDLPIGFSLREAGGGKRFVMVVSAVGTLLVNLEKRNAIDLTAAVGAQGKRPHLAKFSRDERWGFMRLPEKGLVIFSTDDPAKRSVVDGEPLGFSPDGQSIFVAHFTENGPGKVFAQPVEGGDPVVYAEGDVEFRGTVGNSVVIAEPTALSLSRGPGDRRLLNVPYDREKDDDTYVTPVGTGGRALMFSGSREDGHWALLDEADATVTPLPTLDRFNLIEPFDERVVFAGGYTKEGGPASNYAILDIASGNVTPAGTWDPAGTYGGYPVPAPDGRSVAISFGRESEPGHHSVILKPEGITEFNGTITGWAPDASAVLIGRLVDDKPRIFVVDLATKKEKDLGPGFAGVWTTS